MLEKAKKILIAPDKFKGTLSGLQVCRAIGRGLLKFNPSLELVFHPLADGGDGSLDVLANFMHLNTVSYRVADPLGRPINANYFVAEHRAFIEVAHASGLVLLSEGERDAEETSSYGTGVMIREALAGGAKEIVLFLGGSATNDAAMGIAAALGYRFLDQAGGELQPIGKNLLKIDRIVRPARPGFVDVRFTLLTDVQNPMYGPNGAAHVYARQKGADDAAIARLDDGLKNMAGAIGRDLSVEVGGIVGGGAAGGLAAGLVAFVGASVKSGIDEIMRLTAFEEQVEHADLVITGEGRLDQQSLQGKVIDGVCRMSKKHAKDVALFAGQVTLAEEACAELSPFPPQEIMALAKGQQDAFANASAYLENLAYSFASLHKLGKQAQVDSR